MESVVAALLQKNPGIRLVVNTITAENTSRAFALLDSGKFCDMEAVQMQISRAHKVGTSHMMRAENPVTVFAARGNGARDQRGEET